MNTSEEQAEIELSLRGIRLAIQFKTFILSIDLQSRSLVLDYCMRWFELEMEKEKSDENNRLFMWFKSAHDIYQNDAEISKKTLGNLSKSISFQKLVGFIMNGTLSQSGWR
jgi:hypothetical protein